MSELTVTGYGSAAERLPERADAGARRWVELMAPAVELAKHVSNTHFVPAGLRGRPDAIVAAVMYGDELGLGPMRSLSWISIIDGHPSVAAEGYRALVLSRGHSIWPVEMTNTRVTMAGKRAEEDRVVEVTWTMDDAKRAGLSGKQNWRAYPRQMLTARATADLARLLFADVLGGIGVTEEYLEDDGSPAPSGDAAKGDSSEPPKTRRRRRTPDPPPAAAVAASNPESSSSEPPEHTGHPSSGDLPALGDLPTAAQVAQEGEEELLRAATGDVAAKAETDVDAALERMSAEADRVISREKALAERARADTAEPNLITEGQRAKLHALFREREVESREAKLAYASTVARRPVDSSNDLTEAEAHAVIDALTQWNPQDPDSKPFPDYDPATAPWPEGF